MVNAYLLEAGIIRQKKMESFMSTLSINFEEFLFVNVPAAGEDPVQVPAPATIDELMNIVLHGLKQRLGDAAAGKTGDDAKAAILAKAAGGNLYGAASVRGSKASPIEFQLAALIKAKAAALKLKSADCPSPGKAYNWAINNLEAPLFERFLAKAKELAAASEIDIEI